MCGRFTITVTMDELKAYLNDYYDIEDMKSDIIVPRYNVSPGQDVISIINDGTKNRVGLLNWGFVPSFAKDEKIGFSMINAKSETLDQKISYKSSFEHKRCIILADGFYEWKKEDNQKIPMRILMKDKSIFPIAGLWSTYVRLDGTKHHSTTIITTQANDLVSLVHDRMPVILTDESRKTWLNPRITDLRLLSTILRPYEPNQMYTYRVSSVVNSSKNENQACIIPV